jgi:DNA end-binding protein Ku
MAPKTVRKSAANLPSTKGGGNESQELPRKRGRGTSAAEQSAPGARAIWNGTISFGMVSIPVRLYTATQSHDVHFHLLHKRDGVRLQNVRWCPKDQKAVPWDEVVRGFEYAKGQYLPISEEDLEHLPVKTIHTVDISDFVKLEEVDPIYYDKAYYLAPDEAGVKAFVLLRQALEQTGRAAVAKVAIRDKESLCLVRPYQDVLSMDTLFYANEIRSTKHIAVDGVGVSPKEIQMAVSLIENLSDSFDPQRYHDEYQAALKKLMDAKVDGAPLPEPPSERGEKIVDLMEALRASVEATRKKSPGAADAKAPATRTRTISSRRRKSA